MPVIPLPEESTRSVSIRWPRELWEQVEEVTRLEGHKWSEMGHTGPSKNQVVLFLVRHALEKYWEEMGGRPAKKGAPKK